MNRKPYLVIGAAVLAVLSALLATYLIPSRVDFVLDDSSVIKNDAVIKLSSDNYQEELSLPVSHSFRPGKYSVVASAPKAQTLTQEFTVSAFNKSLVRIILLPLPTDSATDESNPDQSSLQTIPFYQFFPYNGGDFTVAAQVDISAQKITKLYITVFHRFAGPDTPDVYSSEREIAVAGAKEYLNSVNFPTDVPFEVIDK